MKKELMTQCILEVTVLQGEVEQSHDFFSKPDLYVTLRLPTACACTKKTRIIENTKTPKWNETFHFHVYRELKNVLEINLYDEDLITDEKCANILFDVSTLTLGRKETKVFIVDDEKQDKLWLEFKMTESAEAPVEFISNGVLLAAPMATWQVKLDHVTSDCEDDLLVKLPGAYCESQVLPLSGDGSSPPTLQYHINKHLETKIELQVEEETVHTCVNPHKVKKELKVSLAVDKDTINLHLNTLDRPEEDMKVRLDHDIPPEEKEFLLKRKPLVAKALQKYLNLESPLDDTQLPTVALVMSGGGSRAMTGMYGFLKGLQNLGLVDAVSYITCLSGSTWSTASLYSDASWSKDGLEKTIALSQKELSKSTASLFSPRQLHSYRSELKEREEEGHINSAIETWGLIIEYLIFGKKHPGKLSDHRRAVSEGQNPLPIYTGVNTKKKTCGSIVNEWCEFTPYEVGFPKYGAFVPVEHFGSEFYLGHVVKALPEIRVSFLLGLWSSVFSASLSQLWTIFTGLKPSWTSELGDRVDRIETDSNDTTLDTMRIMPETSRLSSVINKAPTISRFFNFLRGFILRDTYKEHPDFDTCNDTHPDSFPNKLTPADPILNMVDAGFAVKTPFAPVLRPQRKADVILCLNYSWAENHLLCMKQTQEYCKEHKLPFPKIDFNKYKSQPKKEVYVFEDESNPEAPIVLLFPLVNDSFKEFKEPGVKRSGKKDMEDGNIDVSSTFSPYATNHLTYTPERFQKLLNLTTYNVLNNAAHVTYALKKALNKKGLGLTGVTTPTDKSGENPIP